MTHNEHTRVKIPAILHLYRLGYRYLSLKNLNWDKETNIFTDIFFESLKKLNPEIDEEKIKKLYEKIKLSLDNDDLGKDFYEKFLLSNEIRLIDFENPQNNFYHVITELPYKKDEEEFRPDITLLINGLPLAFIEVKKPNNKEGILAERERINQRFQNKKFKKFINLTQIIVFSNNMEYDVDSTDQLQGTFYSTTSKDKALFHVFREDKKADPINLELVLAHENEELENFILKDNNLEVIKHSPEFQTNKNPQTPTNRILTSLFYPKRLLTFLKYGIVYVKESNKLEKHIMRYQQFFATKAIENTLNKGIKKGIIWHTQGSGKTALAFFNIKYLTDYFQKKSVIPKFYFIVDRIDLLIQAKREFTARSLKVHIVNSKDQLLNDFQSNKAIHTSSGDLEITVVNIQKFANKDFEEFSNKNLYTTNIQRIYFLDEVHRSYDPKGSFLASLISSDREAIIIGLTGTPLIGERSSRAIFGDYIHTYYYNSSIADGYTLRLIREGIETKYKIQLSKILEEIEILKGEVERKIIYSHEKFVEPMLDYIISDFEKSRIAYGDKTIGAMIVADSSDQAKKLFEIFQKKYQQKFSAKLILYDVDDKQIRDDNVQKFKDGKIDFLIVYNMLLTGFDAPRLKKLYLGRVIKRHNLLQALTRVNRPYKNFKYGYVVDFADIRQEFDATNKAYWEELQQELGDELKTYSNILLTKEEIEKEIDNIKEKLFYFDLENLENFSKQISEITDKKQILEVKNALLSAKNLYNIIRLIGHYELLEKLDFKKLAQLYQETENRLNLLNLKESLESSVETTNILNLALENIVFTFRKVSEEEIVIADKLRNILQKTREAFNFNFDKKDPQFVALYDELKRLFKDKNLEEITQEEMTANIKNLEKIYQAITELNRRNALLKAKYQNDEKYVRLHKRIIEKKIVNAREQIIYEALMGIKKQADEKVLNNSKLLENEEYFLRFMSPIVISNFEKQGIKLDLDSANKINRYSTEEYIYQFKYQ